MRFIAAGRQLHHNVANELRLPHFRDSDIVVLSLKGAVVYQFNQHDIHVHPRQLLLLPRDIDTHAWRTVGEESWLVRWFRVALDAHERYLFDYPAHASGARLLDVPPELMERLLPLLQRLAELRGHEDAESLLLCTGLARCALHELRCFYGPPLDPHDAAIARALATIDRRLDDPDLALADLVAAGGCGRSLFVARFTASQGLSPMQHLEERRLRLAATRLRQDADAIASIASDVGFRSPQYFATRFRRRFGQSPRQYRS